MSRRTLAALLGAIAAAAPRAAAACPSCVSSGFGDRSYSWAYLGLILMPFVIAVVIVTVLAWQAGWRWRDVTARVSAWAARRHRPEPASLSPRTHTETT
jgi:hypothetical protein